MIELEIYIHKDKWLQFDTIFPNGFKIEMFSIDFKHSCSSIYRA